ncbi:class IV aminotransferase [Microbispora cellulosiformans]|uniref:Class IV aminotransferase n=1 Tax=Microbispora cellulosiformans TaxID=2614688 RepID=A0A5J5JZG4_9ACTN|nr:class IV aminotransferase [Microbispora cellulosiformans]
MEIVFLRVEIDGRPPTAEALWHPALVNYGHFTALQVRNGRTRGLGLHLARLDAANRELFGAGLDGDLVRERVRHALADDARDASVRVVAYRPEDRGAASLLVAVLPPAPPPSGWQSLKPVPYERPVAHVKHVGGFGQLYHRKVAEREGFDDVLLTGPDGTVAEGGVTNIGFFDGSSVLWPDAPSLGGVTMALLEDRLPAAGIGSRHGPVRLADLPAYRSVFVANSRGLAPVGRIGDVILPVDDDFARTLSEVYEAVPWDPI